MDKELTIIFALFSEEKPVSFEVISTGRSETDFREAVIVTAESGSKLVLKLSDNDFTFPDKIKMWQRTVLEYRALGCYCPLICTDKNGGFPRVQYKGHCCVAYAEEFALYPAAEKRETDFADYSDDRSYMREAWLLTARAAAKHFDYTGYPSGYCLFETFCPSDKTDEVLENALEWKTLSDALPERSRSQAERIWRLWQENRIALEPIYKRLPSSVFQADLNSTNILIDGDRNFKGLMDFNLCGREVFLNYIIRETNDEDPAAELNKLRYTLALVSEEYEFSVLEKNTVLMLYRCLKPLWRPYKLKEAEGDEAKISALLNETEHYLTADIDLASYMTERRNVPCG